MDSPTVTSFQVLFLNRHVPHFMPAVKSGKFHEREDSWDDQFLSP